MIKEFRVNFNQEDLSKIYEKVKNYPWSNISNFDHWQYGTSHSYLKKISYYWVTEFNWPQVQNKINSFSNFKTNVDGMNIHFIKEKYCSFQIAKQFIQLWIESICRLMLPLKLLYLKVAPSRIIKIVNKYNRLYFLLQK